MQVTVADAGTLRKQVTLSIPKDEIVRREDELISRYAHQAHVQGFRPGKAPKSLLRRRLGATVAAETRDSLVQESLQKAVEQNHFHPIGPVASDAKDEQDGSHRCTVTFDIRPEVTLPAPTSFTLPTEDTAPTAEEIETEIAGMRRRLGTYRDLTADDTLVADDVLTLTGTVAVDGATVREVQDLHHILGAYPLFGRSPAEVLAQVATLRTGQVLAFDATLPDNFKPAEAAGKPAHIALTIQRGQRQQPAELTDELAKRVGAESVESLRTRLTDSIRSRKTNELQGRQVEALVTQLLEKTTCPLPPTLLTSLVDERLGTLGGQDEHKGKTPEALRAELGAQAQADVERDLKRIILLDALAAEFKVQATEHDLQMQVAMAAYRSGHKPQEILEHLRSSGQIHQVVGEIRQHKALELLRRRALGLKDED